MVRTWTGLLRNLDRIREPAMLAVFCSIVVLMFVQPVGAQDAGPESEGLTVMSFNVRVDGFDGPDFAWSLRKESAAQVIRIHDADIVGTQEGTYPMIVALLELLPEYDWVGMGRGGGLSSEFMAVFYRKDRLEVIEVDHFWLSETPHIPGSRLPGVGNQRMVTWVHFRMLSNGAEFLFYNSHLDHESQFAREFGARMIHDHLAMTTQSLGIPAIVTADMNAPPTNQAIRILMGTTDNPLLHDTGALFRAHGGSVGATFHGYNGTVQGDPIDYIFHTSDLQPLDFGVARERYVGRYPSDHYPVWTRFAPLPHN